MAISSILLANPPLYLSANPLSALLSLTLALILSLAIYRLTVHPLSSIPGPLLLKLTPLPLLWRSYIGTEATYLTSLFHAAPAQGILRIGPNEVLVADGAALAPIYANSAGGFPKAPCYTNFDIDGFPSLFSALDRAYRAPRAKSVLPMFATGALRRDEAGMRRVAAMMVERLGEQRKRGGKVDLLELARGVAVDVVSGCLFGREYGGLKGVGKEDGEERECSANEFVNAFVGVGRFFFLPNWAFVALEKAAGYLFETRETVESFDSVQGFVDKLVNEADVDDGTYQARMLKLGLSREEVAAQMKDLMFAGTDSSGMNLSTFCWQLSKHPDVYAKVKAEVLQAKRQHEDYDPSALPYLRACLKETLRLSMANPIRLPRVVPAGGWEYTPSPDFSFSSQQQQQVPASKEKGTRAQVPSKSSFVPAGTLVSLQIHTLHHNPAVFPDPYTFRPDRWLDSPPELLEKMSRDHIPFGLGSRQCIARNMAMMELNVTCAAILESGVLDGAKNVGDRIEILEWFNSKVRGESIEVEFVTGPS